MALYHRRHHNSHHCRSHFLCFRRPASSYRFPLILPLRTAALWRHQWDAVAVVDPNPVTKMSIEDLVSDKWFKRSLKSELQLQLFNSDLLKKDLKDESTINAFDIISMSHVLNLSGLSEGCLKKDRRFTAATTMEVIREKLGYKVEGRASVCLFWKNEHQLRVLDLGI